MLSARFVALPVIALTVIVALAQAHSRPGMSQTETRSVYRAVNCATAAAITEATCTFAGNALCHGIRYGNTGGAATTVANLLIDGCEFTGLAFGLYMTNPSTSNVDGRRMRRLIMKRSTARNRSPAVSVKRNCRCRLRSA